MKSKRISVLILSIALILSVTLILVSSGLAKREPNSERITFTGDLVGDQEVEGCCGNAGPWPEYTMFLSDNFPDEFQGNHTGNIFMNGAPGGYKVQFWWTEIEGGNETEYFIEFRGGVVHKDRKTKILTATYENVPSYEIWIGWDLQEPVTVTFTLTRDPHHPANK